jgi:putative ABC transport system permease protein
MRSAKKLKNDSLRCAMLNNYLAVSMRNILKDKFFSAINIAGLSIGLSVVLLITLFVWDEVTFDRYLAKTPGIYKLELQTNFPGRGPRVGSTTAGAGGLGLRAEYPELVADSLRIDQRVRTVTVDDRNLSETVMYADTNFFEFFDVAFEDGNAATAMPDLSTVALSQSAALKFFPGGAAVGRSLILDDGNSYRVGSVFADFPENTHIRPNIIFPIKPSNRDLVSHDEGWWSIGYYSYVRLQEGVSIAQLNAVIPGFIDRHMEAPSPNQAMSQQYSFKPIALADVHFQTAATDAGDPLMLKGFAAIAFVILSIATFNFMNMSISRTVTRTREVAVRKVFGAKERNIIGLLLNETMIMVVISLFIAVVITELSLLWFNDFVAKLMTLETLVQPTFIAGLAGLIVVVCLGAGLYPAKLMANMRPAAVLRGGRSASKHMSRLGMILVTAQFAVAIGLIVTSVVIYQQINYSQSMDPGYNKENLLLVRGVGHRAVRPLQMSLKDQISKLPGVTETALVDQAPGGTFGWIEGVDVVDGVPAEQPISIRGVSIGDGFLKTFGVKLAAGRTLTTERADDIGRLPGADDLKDKLNILVNEQALRTLGLGTADEAIGKTLGQNGAWTIVGVVQDYLWGSSKGTVPAAMFTIDQDTYRLLAVRFQSNDLAQLTEAIDISWAGLIDNRPIRRQFMDERIARLYRVEQRQGELFTLFAVLAVLVSCIGLYGLASFNVAGRTKEIGIRKVLGASSGAVTRRILWDFSKPVFVASVIAWPTAAYLMQGWLAEFTYAIDLGVLPFVGAASLVLLVATLTVGSHALKVATANPIEALRCE